ncbi:galactokinase [Mobilicoccus caccae]|uniref:Galactokinase n=1 Tax=Mobilicoccus caccae TaxID=1859295 RepID=A0ABQ6IW20_9MICO|nr:galactokinase [Mobilicoccus caccae]GMA40927.1 galactokinase [Mobilicoccus caccae]
MGEWEQAWTDDEAAARATASFAAAFGSEPEEVWAAPGRVNLVGEHTDYNGGLCLPIALPHRTYAAVTRRDDDRVRVVTDLGAEQRWEGTLADIAPGRLDEGWVSYCAGPAWALGEDGLDVPGFDLALVSCVPLGAGLSSSAAVECAVGLGLASLAGTPLDGDDAGRARLARACVRAENEVAGAPTGGMDQAASLRARAGHALLLDCRDGSIRQVPLDLDREGLALLVIDTRADHALVDGQYGQRRATCEAAAARLGVPTLADITALDEALASLEDETARRRVRHVVTEIQRVRDLVGAAEAGDWPEVGRLMNDSHTSLRDDYEVSCTELDVAVEAARVAGALGARMTGGGFGGSAIALVRSADAEKVGEAVIRAAAQAGIATPSLHLAVPSAAGERVA